MTTVLHAGILRRIARHVQCMFRIDALATIQIDDAITNWRRRALWSTGSGANVGQF